jgi:hypothetical protein
MMQSDKEKFDVSNLDSEPRAVNTGICAEKRKVGYEDLGISGVCSVELREGLVQGTV